MFNPIKKSASLASLLVQLLDFLAIWLGGWLAYQWRFASDQQWVTPAPSEQLLCLMTAVLATLFLGKVYRMWPGGALAAMVGRVLLGWSTAWLALLVLLALTHTADTFSRAWLVIWLLATMVTLCLGRVAVFFTMAHMRRAGYQHKRLLLVGDAGVLDTVRERVKGATWSGFDIVGELPLSDVAAIAAFDAQHKPDEVWVGLRMADHDALDAVMQALSQSVANIRLLPDLHMYQILNHGMSVTLGIPMVDASVSPMHGSSRMIKAALDYGVASLMLLLLGPVLLLTAAAIKLTSPGPVFYKQKRNGWNGDEIWVYKFRTMVLHHEPEGCVTQASPQDARVTPIGRLLRKTSLDELPQFINVLQGRMSIVGPRPHALAHNAAYQKLIPHYALRHKVKPGITGWAQICGYRGRTETLDKMEGRIKHDIYYLEHWSIWLDLKIILLTPLALIQGQNAY